MEHPNKLYLYAYGQDWSLQVELDKYLNNNSLAIRLIVLEGGEYPGEALAVMTVNLHDGLKANQAYVDVNNCPWAEKLIHDNKLGKHTGGYAASGFCLYPLYSFDLKELEYYRYKKG